VRTFFIVFALVVGLALSSLAGFAQAAERLGDAGSVYSYTCYVSGSNPVRDYCDEIRSGGETYQSYNQRSCEASEAANPDTRSCFGPYDPDDSGTLLRWTVFICSSGYIQAEGGGSYGCYDEPEPEPECPIPAGETQEVVSSSPLGSDACYSNCVMTTQSSGSIPWIQKASGERIYFYDATSTGVYCDESDGAEPSEPWDEYTDEDGCYQGFDGRYCPDGGGGCPNSATAPNGQTYCRSPETDESCNEAGGSTGDWYCGQDDPNYEEPSDSDGNADSDGDGIPNKDDPYSDDPDADGDGTPDGEQDGDGNGIPDGEPGGIEDDGDGDSGNGEQGSHDGGTCEKEERREPDCSDDMNSTRCALAIELFHVRCDQELWRDDLKGTEDFNEDSDGDSLLDDGNEKNKVKKADVDVSEYFDGFDDSGFLQGTSSAPVFDFQFYGKSYEFDMTPFWDLAGMLGYLILAMAYYWAARIVAEGI